MGEPRFWMSCREAIELLDAPQRLSAFVRVGLWLHLFICHACRVYRGQLEALKRGCRALAREQTPSAEEVRALEDRVLQALERRGEE